MYSQILKENIKGCATFVYALATHEGVLNTDRLHKVVEDENKLRIVLGDIKEKKNNFSIGMGGEVANSFCTLYEAAYFFQALFLSAIGTAVINKGWLEKYKKESKKSLPNTIQEDLLLLSEIEINNALLHPAVAIVSSLDTDIVPIRYNKHQLWQLKGSSLNKRVESIDSRQYNKSALDMSGKDVHWVQKDVDIAQKAMGSGYKLPYVKALQFYQVFKIICTALGININDVPLYFNFVPKQEIIENGIQNSYLKVLLALHSRHGRRAYKLRTGISKPWMIGVSCPKCGMGSKRVIAYKLLEDNKSVNCFCRNNYYSYRNERGDVVQARGCGHRWQITIPQSAKDLWQFIKDNDITLHFATRWLICLLKDSVDTPVGYVLTDIGITRDKDGKLKINPIKIKGYGDHRKMLISALELQDWLINENIESLKSLKDARMIMPRPLYLFGHDRPISLVDKKVSTKENDKTFVSDTSFMKALGAGNSIRDMFKKSIIIYPYTLDVLRSLNNGDQQQSV